jgi:hypothetical protein
MLGAPMMLVEAVYRALAHPDSQGSDRFIGALSVLYAAGWICTAVGMRRRRVMGEGALSAAVSAVQLAGLALAGVWAVSATLGDRFRLAGVALAVTDAAWPLSHLFLLAVGVLVLRAGVWRGWRRYAPLACGLALPAFFLAGAAGARAAGVWLFGILTAAGFLALGYAVRTCNQTGDQTGDRGIDGHEKFRRTRPKEGAATVSRGPWPWTRAVHPPDRAKGMLDRGQDTRPRL